jgi:hypothetical protein
MSQFSTKHFRRVQPEPRLSYSLDISCSANCSELFYSVQLTVAGNASLKSTDFVNGPALDIPIPIEVHLTESVRVRQAFVNPWLYPIFNCLACNRGWYCSKMIAKSALNSGGIILAPFVSMGVPHYVGVRRREPPRRTPVKT